MQKYLYPHEYPIDCVAQQYLPEALKNKEYYQPKTNGKYEQGLKKTYDKLTQMQRKEQNFAD